MSVHKTSKNEFFKFPDMSYHLVTDITTQIHGLSITSQLN